jgi:chemotaxis protein methyltransferase CheR
MINSCGGWIAHAVVTVESLYFFLDTYLMDDQQFRQLLRLFDLSWDGYRKVRKGVKKRIARHMQRMGYRTMDGYLRALGQSPDDREVCERLLTVSISRFFRDPSLWQALKDEILPGIITVDTDKVDAWSAGCACGEEVYSLKILWDVMGADCQECRALHVLATDSNPVYLDKARSGIYTRSSFKEMHPALKVRYFDASSKGTTFAVTENLKTRITWQCQDLLSDPPDASFQLIFLRNNLLTYYLDVRKLAPLHRIIDCLTPAGFLIIGMGEKMPREVQGLFPHKDHPCIYKKENG